MMQNDKNTEPPASGRSQFSLRSMFVVVTIVAALLALFTNSNQLVRSIAGTVLAANLIGWVAGQVITHGFGFPRDGSYRHDENDD